MQESDYVEGGHHHRSHQHHHGDERAVDSGHHTGRPDVLSEPVIGPEDFVTEEEFERIGRRTGDLGSNISHDGRSAYGGAHTRPGFDASELNRPLPTAPSEQHGSFGPYGAAAIPQPQRYAAPTGPPPGYNRAAIGDPAFSDEERLTFPEPDYSAQEFSPNFNAISRLASVHYTDTDPALFHEVSQRLQTQHHGPHTYHAHAEPPPETAGLSQPSNQHAETHEDMIDTHAQAYGEENLAQPPPGLSRMNSQAIGSAAAVQAFKIAAEQNRPHTGSHHVHANQGTSEQNTNDASSSHPAEPSAAVGHAEDEQQSAHPAMHAPQSSSDHPQQVAPIAGEAPADGPSAGGGGPEEKIIALAIAQAAKLFDKQSGGKTGNNPAKTEAMHAAGAAAIRLLRQYKTTGKLSLEPGELQKLIGAAVSLF